MRRKVVCFLIPLLLLGAAVVVLRPKEAAETSAPPAVTSAETQDTAAKANLNPVRAVWLSYVDLKQPAPGISGKAFKEKYEAAFVRMAAMGLTDVFIQVRPFSDAIYPSKLAPWSHILTGTQGKDPGYDPLAILVDAGHKNGLAVHAWLNPFRIWLAEKDKLALSNPALEHLAKKDAYVREAAGGYYWNPALPAVHTMIYDTVEEILKGYAVDGIHIDDYFYPTTDAAFDKPEYEAYKKSGGTLSLADWRRSVVDSFVSGLYNRTKAAKPGAIVSISPAANIEKNRTEMYADVAVWAATPGYCDWLIPQLYFGFEHPTFPFAKTAKAWAALPQHSGLRLIAGLAPYKAGVGDPNAGEAADEWQKHQDILGRQAQEIQKLRTYQGFALYSYASVCGENLTAAQSAEMENLENALR
ncbi:MAG: family 10 glycosylhydrolase [Oscillospiraceae bacterium]|jgi:uncharacterized lipoprotein YddW (UPF0748 family)|nr:family 10 glycosylhydrolase [Oscillospiraceae bacterium]